LCFYEGANVNVNFAEILVVCVVALLLFGPEQLPQIARQFGKLTGDLRKVTNSVRREWYNAVYPPAAEFKGEYDAAGKALRTLKAQVLAPPDGSRGTSGTANTESQSDSSQPITQIDPAPDNAKIK
jgi:Tat protein translocase TatB subunit